MSTMRYACAELVRIISISTTAAQRLEHSEPSERERAITFQNLNMGHASRVHKCYRCYTSVYQYIEYQKACRHGNEKVE